MSAHPLPRPSSSGFSRDKTGQLSASQRGRQPSVAVSVWIAGVWPDRAVCLLLTHEVPPARAVSRTSLEEGTLS